MLLDKIWVGWTIISSVGSALAALVAILYTRFTYRLLKQTNDTFDKTNNLNEFIIYK